MSRFDELRDRNQKAQRDCNITIDNWEKNSDEIIRVSEIVHNPDFIINDLDSKFEKATKLSEKDVKMLFLAIALQCVRQYIFTYFPERLNDKEAAKQVKKGKEEHSDRKHRLYCPSLEEIITNPVPFDANIGSSGALAGAGKLGHRVSAIGHDPIVGLVVGTANIATSTLTTWDMKSYHIKTQNKMDFFYQKASTSKVFYYTKEKLLNEGIEGKEKVAYSLLKEIKHLQSDIGTKNSLPLPIISLYSPQLASQLAEYGMDMANMMVIVKQTAIAQIINWIISMLHGLFLLENGTFTEDNFDKKKEVYEVKTRKIISYSNVIATSSNVICVAFSKDLDKFDIGGMLVTIQRIVKDREFIKKIKQEFLQQEFYKIVMGEES